MDVFWFRIMRLHFQIQIQNVLIAIIQNMNKRGRPCIGSLHRIALQKYPSTFNRNYTCSNVKHTCIKEKQIAPIMAMVVRNPSGFMGSIYNQHFMFIQKQVQGAKHFQGTLHTVISMAWHKAATCPVC